jgi:cardiolipin synthase
MNNAIEQLFFNGQTYFDALIADLENAQQSIEIEAYIFDLDHLGKKIIQTLEEASNRGVKVRILVDGAGTHQWGGSLIKHLERSGVETRIFHPFPWRLWQWSHSRVSVPSILKAIYLLLKINSRNHRKVCIIDNNKVYIGSFNISQKHLNAVDKGKSWRDTGVCLKNVNIDDLQQAFDAAWNHIPVQERIKQFFRHIYTNPIIRLNNTRHRRRILYKDLLSRIKKSTKRIWITNAYFVPDNFLLKKLKDAAKSGVDVRILLPRKSDVTFMPWASKAFYESLLKSGIRIFEYRPSMLHAKTLILDNWMLIGSSNLNHRSLLHDLEVDVNLRQKESKNNLEKQFLLDLQEANEIVLNNWQKPPLHHRIIGRLVLYLKYLI